jgi:Predicted hydrolase (HD superfamily)
MNNLDMDLKTASGLFERYITDSMTKLHSRESEVFMRALARRFGENEDDWGIIGLLHDIDWDLTKK